MSRSASSIEAIVKGRLCHGCGVCAGLFPDAISMVDHEELGRRPIVKHGCHVESRAAAAVCSGARQTSVNLAASDGDRSAVAGQTLDRWGAVLEVWEGHAVDPEIRFHGSSGGVVTALAHFSLAEQCADAVIHTKADSADPAKCQSTISRNRSELLSGAGSRYAPASPGEQLANFKAENDERIVFIGKPCDVASLRRAQSADPKLAEQVTLVLGIFCAGTPSTKASRLLIDRLAADAKMPRVDRFRYRGQGWPGRMTASMITDDVVSAENSTTYDIGWGQFLQPFRPWRCRLCADHGAEHADIAIGDPWYDQPTGQSAGRSLIVVRTEHGRAMLHAAMAAGYLVADQRDAEDIDRAQPNLVQTRSAYFGRALATRMIGLPSPIYAGSPLFRLWRERSFVQKLRDVLGSLKRLISRRLYRAEKLPVPGEWR